MTEEKDPNKISRQILNKMLKEDFTCTRQDLPNREYLEKNLLYLERMAISYRNQSEDSQLSPRSRASARDLLQNCYGLINGIKFGISFLDHKDVNLFQENQNTTEQEVIVK